MFRFFHCSLLCLCLFFFFTTVISDSLNAFIPTTHKSLYDSYNALAFGDVSLARAAIRGALAVQYKADLADFDIAAHGDCDHDRRALIVGGSLTARMGAINSGYAVVGRRSSIHHTVRLTCTSRVEQYDPVRNGDMEFEEMRREVLKEMGGICVKDADGEVEVVNGTMKFKVGDEETFGCYKYFKVTTEDMRVTNRWEMMDGKAKGQNIVIVVSGKEVEMRDFEMTGFNSKRTLIAFCAVYGKFGVYNAKIHGSVLAPTASFTTSNAIFNGSLIVGNLRGSLATLNTPYVTC